MKDKLKRNSRKPGFGDEITHVLEPYFVKTRFNAGRILWREGESAGKMVSIVTGKVKIFRPLPDGKQAAIYIFGPGDMFGFLPFIDGSPYPASAETIEETLALVMTREKLRTVMKQHPDVAFLLLEHLGKRLRGAFDQIERLSTRGVLPKIAAALHSLSIDIGQRAPSVIISLPASSREYASLVGLTPESFSRGITRLADMGIIHRLQNNSYQILNPESLAQEAGYHV